MTASHYGRQLSRSEQHELFGGLDECGIATNAGQVTSLKVFCGVNAKYPNEVSSESVRYCHSPSKSSNTAMRATTTSIPILIIANGKSYFWGNGRLDATGDDTILYHGIKDCCITTTAGKNAELVE